MAIPAAEREAARQYWLERLSHEHRQRPGGRTALELARILWLGGEYEHALIRFLEARDRMPDSAEAHVALLRSASMLCRDDVEKDALSRAIAMHRGHPGVAMHAALTLVPDDFESAAAWLEPHQALPLHRQYLDAVRAAEAMAIVEAAPHPDPRFAARHDSLLWSLRHARSAQDFVGLPTGVLRRALAAAPTEGITIECGVYHGRSLDILARHTAGAVHGFDSFRGLPEAWSNDESAGSYSTSGRLPEVRDNVVLHAGWFEDTLPPFFAGCDAPIRLLHVDCDIYSSTRTVLAAAVAHLRPGSMIVFDDLLGYPGYEQHELRAFEEFAHEHDVAWELVAVGLLGRVAAVRLTHIPGNAHASATL